MPRPSARLRCEPLESRVNPSFVPEREILVTTAADVVDPNDGVISLREAIADANTEPPVGDEPPLYRGIPVIRFAPELAGATIQVSRVGGTTVGPAAFEIRKYMQIDGSGQTITRAAGAPTMRLFSVLRVSDTQAGSLYLENVELVGGDSNGPGGAIYSQSGVTVSGSVLANNSAVGSGGAIYSVGGYVSVYNSTLTGNTVRPTADGTSRGGAVYVVDDPLTQTGSLNVSICTLAGNTAAQGNQVYAAGVVYLTVENSILFSRPVADAFDLIADPAAQVAYPGKKNVIGTWSNYPGGVVSTADPLLGPLQDNGGPTRTMLPAAGSPAVDAGEGVNNLNYLSRWDQRGFVRGVGGRTDVGAVEVGANETGAGYEPPATVVGAAAGQPPEVRVLRADGTEVKRFLAYDGGFRGGVSVMMADVTGDGVQDILTAAKAGGGPHVKIFDGFTYQVVREWMAYDVTFAGGVSLAVADVNLDGKADVITGAGPGGGPHVKVFDGTGTVTREWMAFDIGFRGGVNLASLEYGGGLVVGAGPGGGPHVKLYTFDTEADPLKVAIDFFAYDPAFSGGVNVTYLNGQIVTGTMTGGPHVKIFSDERWREPDQPRTREVGGFFTGPASATTGVTVGRGAFVQWPPERIVTDVVMPPPAPYLYTATGDGGLARYTFTYTGTDTIEATLAPLDVPVSGVFGSVSGLGRQWYAIPAVTGD